MYALAKPADFEFPREEVLKLAEQQVHGVTSLEEQFSSARTSDLFTHVFTRVLPSHYGGVNSFRARSALVLHEKTRIAVTRLVWTAVILDSSEIRRPLSNSRTLKTCS